MESVFAQVSAEVVVQGFIDRIREVNPLINSVVDERYEQALKEARDADAFLASTTLSAVELKLQKPFLGVPFTTKDSTAVKGLFPTNACLQFPDHLHTCRT
jgi:fatty acid amide hydrolase 2